MSKRLLSLLLVLAMVLSMMPMGVLAEEDENEISYERAMEATAIVDYAGVNVTVKGRVSDYANQTMTVVAAAYDYDSRMINSVYDSEVRLEWDGSFWTELVLPDLWSDQVDVRVFLLKKDLQPVIGGNFAQWAVSDNGIDGDISWTMSHGELTLSGEDGGEFTGEPHEWDRYIDQIKTIQGVYGFTHIADNAFCKYTSMTKLKLAGIETIGAGAFQGLKNLKYITLVGNGHVSVGENAFAGLSPDVDITLRGWEDVTIAPGNDALLKALEEQEISGFDNAEETVPEATEETVPEATEETVPETTEETVPETTEETVPETTEEAVPETTEETVPETVEEELTAQQAAEEGYYIAPEGAQLTEEAAAEEMAAYNGTDKVSRGVHTASFTGLLPRQLYALVVSKTPGSLGNDDLQYINVIVSDEAGNLKISYIPKTEDKAIVQVYGPEQLVLTASQDYVVLHPGEETLVKIEANANVRSCWYQLSEYAGLWVSQGEDGWILAAEEGYDLTKPETRYVEFFANDGIQDARVRVRVDLVPSKTQVTKAELAENKLTYNVYSDQPLEIPVRLTLNVPETAEVKTEEISETAALAAEETSGRLIQTAAFTDKSLEQYFTVDVQDDHTLLLRVREDVNLTDAKVVKAIKSSYKMSFHLTFADQEEEKDTGVLTLAIQKKLPTIKAKAVTLNPYYQTKSMVTFTGGTVTSVEAVTADDLLQLKDENGSAFVSLAKVPGKTVSKNLAVWASVEGYGTPVKVTIPVKVDAKAPALKLKQTTWTVSSLGYQWIDIPVQSATKGVELETLDIRGLEVLGANGKVSENYAATSSWDPNSLGLCAIDLRDDEEVSVARPAGKENLTIRVKVAFQNGNESFEEEPVLLPIDLKMTVVSKNPVVKLNKSQVTLNCGFGEQAYVTAAITLPSGSGMPDTHYYYHNVIGKRTGDVTDYFELKPLEDGTIGINLDRDAFFESFETYADQEKAAKDTYTMYIDVADNTAYKTWTKLTIRLSLDLPTVTAKASGSIDLNNDRSAVTITPSYKGMDGCTDLEVTVRDSSGNDCTGRFLQEYDEKGRLLLRTNPADRPDAGKYTATVKLPYWANSSGSSAKVSFNVAKTTKLTAKVTGKMDSGLGDKYALITSNYNRMSEYGFFVTPEVTLWTTGKNSKPVDPSLYMAFTNIDSTIELYASTYADSLLSPGKYTVKLDYGDGTVISAPVTVTQTAPTLKLMKSSVTIHPYITQGFAPVWIKSWTDGTWGERSTIQYYQSNGKTEWKDSPVEATMNFKDGYLTVSPVEGAAAPAKDTIVKIKLTPDSRIPSKYTWLTVKVLGGRNLNQKVTLKAMKTIDPSAVSCDTEIQTTLKGFDNRYTIDGNTLYEIGGEAVLQMSTDKGRSYNTMPIKPGDTVSPDYVCMAGLSPAYKYRLRVTYYGGNGMLAASGTVDLKVAYGSNKFTVAKAPTLYKKTDPYAAMDIHLNAKNLAQQIENVTIKGNTGFEISRSMVISEGRVPGSQYDWVLRYTGKDLKKLKTTNLTLQIFLKGNTTTKPNFTTNVKVTVK